MRCIDPAACQSRHPPAAARIFPATASHGGDGLLGRSVDAVGTLLGKPRLDVTEGAGRKLQFAGDSCVIDVYFYAPKAGAKPVATHIDARSRDGRAVDTNGCITVLRRR